MSASDSPLDLPVFGGASGRVRSEFRYGNNDPIERPGAVVTDIGQGRRRPPAVTVPDRAAPVVDWGLVADLRAEVSRRLSDRMGESLWDSDRKKLEGRELIGSLLDERAADALAPPRRGGLVGASRRRWPRRSSTPCSGWVGCSRWWTTTGSRTS